MSAQPQPPPSVPRGHVLPDREHAPRPAAPAGHRGGADPQAFASLGQSAHLRRSGRGQAACAGLFRTAQKPAPSEGWGARAVDAEASGNGSRGTTALRVPTLDAAARGLRQLPSAVRNGLIRATLDPNTTTRSGVAGHLGGLDADLATLGLGPHRFFRQNAVMRKTNWRLIVDAFIEFYHIKRLRVATVGQSMRRLPPIGSGSSITRTTSATWEFFPPPSTDRCSFIPC
jgi:hypothetical protein